MNASAQLGVAVDPDKLTAREMELIVLGRRAVGVLEAALIKERHAEAGKPS